MKLTLSVLPGRFGICRLDVNDAIPAWVPISAGPLGTKAGGGFVSVTRTGDELSIVCPESAVPEAVTCERSWRCLKVAGPLDLSLTGVLAGLASPLAEWRVNVFAVSTYDTDYLLVKDEQLSRAVEALTRAGHRIEPR